MGLRRRIYGRSKRKSSETSLKWRVMLRNARWGKTGFCKDYLRSRTFDWSFLDLYILLLYSGLMAIEW